MRVEQEAMLAQLPPVAGRRVLDLACGSGRYARLLAQKHAASVIALDFSESMLRQVAGAPCLRASMMQLPFASSTFGAVICGLAIAHAPDIDAWMTEVTRVLEPGGELLYSDFHPDAARAGMTRSFRDEYGQKVTVPHQRYEVEAQKRAATAAGLSIVAVQELRVGHEFREPFPGSDAFHARWHGLPLVLVVRARK
jgi:malonyl-CoA O-methyltransferase